MSVMPRTEIPVTEVYEDVPALQASTPSSSSIEGGQSEDSGFDQM